MRIEYNYCPRCSQPLRKQLAFGRERPVCQACGFVHFQDPKVAVSVLVSQNGRILLVQRAVVPRIGYWALPAGFMEYDEMPEQTATREVCEETGLDVRLDMLMGIRSIANPEKPGILIVYRGHPQGGSLRPGDDVSDARWFAPAEIPWDALAFATTHELLRAWSEETTTENHV